MHTRSSMRTDLSGSTKWQTEIDISTVHYHVSNDIMMVFVCVALVALPCVWSYQKRIESKYFQWKWPK